MPKHKRKRRGSKATRKILGPDWNGGLKRISGTISGRLVKGAAGERTCRVCGCTSSNCNRCIARIGVPCYWIEADLCSACAPVRDPLLFAAAAQKVLAWHDWFEKLPPAIRSRRRCLTCNRKCDGQVICNKCIRSPRIGQPLRHRIRSTHGPEFWRALAIAIYALHGGRLTPCALCGYEFDYEMLGKYGCPNCNGEGLHARRSSAR